jgi:hypothetical protein
MRTLAANDPNMNPLPDNPAFNKMRSLVGGEWLLLNGGTNMDPAKDMNMHEGTITFIDDDHIETHRQSCESRPKFTRWI